MLSKTPDHNTVPAYRRIANELRNQIKEGHYPPGVALPSERKLIERFEVSRMTIRAALQQLRAEGLILMERGAGIFVREHPPRHRLVRDQEGKKYFFNPTAQAWVAVGLPQTFWTESIPGEVSEMLRVKSGEQVLVHDRKMGTKLGEQPSQLATSYIPQWLAEKTRADSGPEEIYNQMRDISSELYWIEQVTARMPTPDESATLGLADGVPVLRIMRTTLNKENVPLEVNDTRMSAEEFELAYTLERAAVEPPSA